jgi:hypothetical protein
MNEREREQRGIPVYVIQTLVGLNWLTKGKRSSPFRPFFLQYQLIFHKSTLSMALGILVKFGYLERTKGKSGWYKFTDEGNKFLTNYFTCLEYHLDRIKGILNGYEMQPTKLRRLRKIPANRCE